MALRAFDGKTALVTGAASGIGRATALALARRGMRLVVCDVNEDGLAEVAAEISGISDCLLSQRVDVSNRDEMTALADAVHDRVPAVDLLVNNAGVGIAGGILDTTEQDWDWIVGVNQWGVINGCRLFVPRMVERGTGGHVVNVSSALGYFPAGNLVAYTTTKYAVLGFSEAMRMELAAHDIGVSAICPGLIATNIVQTARFRLGDDPEGLKDRMHQMYKRRGSAPEGVAKAILSAIRHNRAVVPVTPEAWAAYWLKRFLPGLAPIVARFTQEQVKEA